MPVFLLCLPLFILDWFHQTHHVGGGYVAACVGESEWVRARERVPVCVWGGVCVCVCVWVWVCGWVCGCGCVGVGVMNGGCGWDGWR